MNIKTDETKEQVLEKLLNDARAEADGLRRSLQRYENIIGSTRLIMGHEMKKPATAIAGYLDLVSEDLENKGDFDALTFVKKALEECALLSDLNKYFIELLKIGQEGDIVGREPVDVCTLVGEVVAHVRRSEKSEREITLKLDVSDALVEIDANALRLVMMNLLENALKYSQVDTPVRVEIEKGFDRRNASARPLLKLRVIDDGVGISPKHVGRVFDPFVRLQQNAASGSGLGLTLVRSLVELSGGEVSIQSRSGQGTTVYVTLPVIQQDGRESIIHP